MPDRDLRMRSKRMDRQKHLIKSSYWSEVVKLNDCIFLIRPNLKTSLTATCHFMQVLSLLGGSKTEGLWREKIPVEIFDAPNDLSLAVAHRIAALIRSRASESKKAILGLPTGSTPIGVYQHLITMHREEGLDFSHVVTFNLDEYYPMNPDSLQSYHRFMKENFFDHVNVPTEAIHVPRGDLKREDVLPFCEEYEQKIRKAGGLDLILLGIGRTGHIGFNEPGSGPETRTRPIILDEITRKDAASDFFWRRERPS